MMKGSEDYSKKDKKAFKAAQKVYAETVAG